MLLAQATKAVDQITVVETGVIYYREVARVFRDGEQIAQSYARASVAPGDSLDGSPSQVAAIAQVVWTPDVIEAYKASLVVPEPQQ